MYKSSGNLRQASLFWDLESVLDSKHPLYKLANLVDWDMFESPSLHYIAMTMDEQRNLSV